jgi:hypothetical protein
LDALSSLAWTVREAAAARTTAEPARTKPERERKEGGREGGREGDEIREEEG